MNGDKAKQVIVTKQDALYEDDKVLVFFPDDACCKGHFRILPKQQFQTLEEMDDKLVQHLFFTASFSATALFENLQAQGTNIICSTGNSFKEENSWFHIDVIARFQDDGLDFVWDGEQADPASLEDVVKKIKDETDFIGQEKAEKKDTVIVEKPKDIIEADDDDTNYLIRQLRRIG